MLSRKAIEERKKKFHNGMRIRLISMDDVQAPPNGTFGTVQYVDDIGTIGVAWDNGSSLGLVPEAGDRFEIV